MTHRPQLLHRNCPMAAIVLALLAGILLAVRVRADRHEPAAPPPAAAREYVVDAASPCASDDNPGTVDRPLKTIDRAAQRARAGDRVRVRAGTYREAVHLRYSGLPRAPITFTVDPPGTVTVTGADVITGWRREPGGEPIYRVPWSTVFAIDYHNGKPVEFHPEDAPLWGRAEQVIADDRQLLPAAGMAELRKAWRDRHPIGGSQPPALPGPLPRLGGPFAGEFFADTPHKMLYPRASGAGWGGVPGTVTRGG